MVSHSAGGGLDWMVGKIWGGSALEGAAQGSGGVSIPGGDLRDVWETSECGTEGCGLGGGTWYIRLVVGLADLEGLFHPKTFCGLEMYDFFEDEDCLKKTES